MPSWLPTPNHARAHAVPDGAEPVRYRPLWRWVVALAAGYVALAGTSFSPPFDRHAAPPATSAAAAGRAHGVAVNGSVATTADVRSDTRHG
ncbi:hypothetical protein [Amycolatopsis sp. NPDC021455]|uniref:hypothetical protein n=1 Tax=Amycolatopsis sp. NPDC021455 TaxID=3154901 RepID=UPI0033F119A4